MLIRWLSNYQGPRYPSRYPCHYGPKWLLELQPSHSIPWSFTKERAKKEKPFLFKDTFQRSRTTSIAYISSAKSKLQSQPTTRKARKCDPLAGRLENLCFIIEREWGYPGRQLCRRLDGNPWMNSPPKKMKLIESLIKDTEWGVWSWISEGYRENKANFFNKTLFLPGKIVICSRKNDQLGKLCFQCDNKHPQNCSSWKP